VNISSIAATFRAALVVVLIAAAGSGCYIWESVEGQLALMSKREPITRVIADSATSPALRSQLEAVAAIRDFASRELRLPDNGSYRSYADVGRRYVVWNVVAAPEFSVDPREWCYPVVGCVAYRGYFAEDRARGFAAKLRGQGLDVAVGGVAAYSTLGHFNDPVLNTMMDWNDVELAAIIFHELTHQLIYVPNDSAFNEALATTVEEEGVRRWLRAQGRDADMAAHLLQQERYLKVIGLLNATRAELRAIYASGLPPEQVREKKRAAFLAMRSSFALLKADWDGMLPSNPGSPRTSTTLTWHRSPPISTVCRDSSASSRLRAATFLPSTPESADSRSSIKRSATPSYAVREGVQWLTCPLHTTDCRWGRCGYSRPSPRT
jgi:predicted aminopeptidase